MGLKLRREELERRWELSRERTQRIGDRGRAHRRPGASLIGSVGGARANDDPRTSTLDVHLGGATWGRIVRGWI